MKKISFDQCVVFLRFSFYIFPLVEETKNLIMFFNQTIKLYYNDKIVNINDYFIIAKNYDKKINIDSIV